MTSQSILRLMDPKVFDLIQRYRVTDDAMMPFAYQKANPQGRPLHDDWFLARGTPRIETAYRVPLPFKQIGGKSEKRWVLWDGTYPTSPGTPIEYKDYHTVHGKFSLPHALIDCAVENSGWSEFAVWIDGEWHPCFRSYRKMVLGRRLAYYSGGLKCDVTVGVNPDGSIRSDLMGWLEFPTCSWLKER